MDFFVLICALIVIISINPWIVWMVVGGFCISFVANFAGIAMSFLQGLVIMILLDCAPSFRRRPNIIIKRY